jgi:hypothetical protein
MNQKNTINIDHNIMEKKLMFFKNNYVEIGPYNQINTKIPIVFFIHRDIFLRVEWLKFIRTRDQAARNTNIVKKVKLFFFIEFGKENIGLFDEVLIFFGKKVSNRSFIQIDDSWHKASDFLWTNCLSRA